jgi:two-component system, NarL family, nitrate/nitrite response regulator NarL
MIRQRRKTHVKQLSIVLADGHTLFRSGLRLLIDDSGAGVVVVGEAKDGFEAIRKVLKLRPNILVLDLALPQLGGLEVLRRIRLIENVRKIILTDQIEQEDVAKALRLGVSGIILKKSFFDNLIRCIESVGDGGTWIGQNERRQAKTKTPSASEPRERRRFRVTNREMEIISAVAAGCTNQEIATQLSISVQTVKHHLTNVFNKTGTSTRLELVVFVIENGLLDNSRLRAGSTDSDAQLDRTKSA